ncbi:MAG: glycosyltransferase family 1 protein [Candidatus Tokpelaia sp.]|nr:MAG: glycosyltransferase family 1 protein [Candidatus Tokpelaia sp.]
MRILFDGRYFCRHLDEKVGGRSGIFFVTFNLLQEFCRREGVSVTLHIDSWANKEQIAAALERDFDIDAANLDFLAEDVQPNNAFERFYKRLFAYKEKKKRKKQFVGRSLMNIVLFIPKKIRKLIWSYNKKAYAAAVSGHDAYFSPAFYFSNYIEKNPALKKFIILHDVIPLVLEGYNIAGGGWLGKICRNISAEDTAFAVSAYTKKDFQKFVGPERLNDDNCYVTPLAASDNFYQETDERKIAQMREKYHIPAGKKYILSLCTVEPRKNLKFAVRNFIKFLWETGADDIVFALGGGHWDDFIKEMEADLANLGKCRDKVIRLGYIDDKDMAALYSGALCFIYPSLYEGFGLPPLEAMQCGTPVITSNVSSLPEVVGSAALTINPESDVECVDAFTKIYSNAALRCELSAKGLERAAQFSWAKTADSMLAVMREKINNRM